MEVDQGEPCPFVYAKGKKCTGHIWRIEAFKVDISWSRADDGKWSFAVGEPRSHYHLYCSEKGNGPPADVAEGGHQVRSVILS